MDKIKKVSEIDFYPMKTLAGSLGSLFKKEKIEFVNSNNNACGVSITKNGFDRLSVGEMYVLLYNPNTNIGECADNNIRMNIQIKHYGELRFEVPVKLFDNKYFIKNLCSLIGCISPYAKSIYWIRSTKKWAIKLIEDIELNKYEYFK